MKDIRLLTLYKQHYLDHYDVSMDSQITCLGYYDGLDVKKVETEELFGNKKFQKKLAAATEIWYSTGKSIEQLSGGHSSQNIGLFRYSRSKEQQGYTVKYWDMEKNLPYFSVAFLKLKENTDYSKVSCGIERHFLQGDKELKNKVCIALTYDTIDNSDLIVLLKSNSMAEIGHALDYIETEPQHGVIYMHSILGIEEAYLKECMEENQIIGTWRGSCCFVDDQVERMELHLAACGGSGILKGIKSILDEWNEKWGIQGYKNMVYSYVGGHGNINIKLPQTDVRSLLVFLLPGGFSTHQNPSYKNGVYNIETDIFVEEMPWKGIQGSQAEYGEKNTGVRSDWCRKLIQKYRKLCSGAMKAEDDSLYASYQALIQTLNALDQYERFSMSRDIFDTIYPSFAIFNRKIDAALEDIHADGNMYKTEQLKEMMREYLECVNSVVYHTIHTEQVFLMIPGYSGTSFSIPIKLHLFYLWFVYTVIDLLNDCGKLHGCIVVPVMESRPDTRFIGMDFNNDEKLIHIRLSQRSLFQPGALMIILAHEMAHYIGREIRLRDLRIGCILKTMAYCMAEAVCPQEDIGAPFQITNTNIFRDMKARIKNEIQVELGEWFKKKKQELNDGYYGDEILDPLMRWAVDVFKEEGEEAVIYQCIHTISDEIIAEIRREDADYAENMRQIYRMQQYFNRNRKMWVQSGTMQRIVKDLLELYKEVFADMSALAVLKCNREEFQNAFFVSDGAGQSGRKEKQQQIRERIANAVVFHENLDEIRQNQDEEYIWTAINHKLSQEVILRTNLPRYTWVNHQLETYAKECYNTVHNRLEKDNEKTEEVKTIYELFKNPKSKYDQIFACLNTCIKHYKDMVKKPGMF